MIKPSGKLRVFFIFCIILFLRLLPEPIFLVNLFLIFVLFFFVIIFLVLSTAAWLSPVRLAWKVGSRRCLFFLVLIIDVEVYLGLGFMGFKNI